MLHRRTKPYGEHPTSLPRHVGTFESEVRSVGPEGGAMRSEIIEATIEAWTKAPEQARGAPVVTARADDSQAVIQAGPFTWRADLPPALGGTNEAPSPTALLLSALAGCAVVFIRDTLGPQLGVRVDAVEATV